MSIRSGFTDLAWRCADAIGSRLRVPTYDSLEEELEIAVGTLLCGDDDRFIEYVFGGKTRREATARATLVAERLITTITMVSAETDEDWFDVWARQCQFFAEQRNEIGVDTDTAFPGTDRWLP